MPDGLLLALGAGMLAAVNPCGFAMLPAYLSLLVVGDQPAAHRAAVGRALGLTVAMTAGFVGVFGVVGLVVATVVSSVQQFLPWLTVVLGLALLPLGLWLLAGRELPGLRVRAVGGAPSRGSWASVTTFGVSYGLVSLTCTLAPFLAVVVASFAAGSVWAGLALFVTYALGMGLVVGTAAVAVALARSSLVGRLRRAGAVVPRVAGGLLLVVGAYVAYYGWWDLRVLAGGSADDPVIDAALQTQRQLVGAVDTLGPVGLLALLTLLVGIAMATTRWLRRGRGAVPAARPTDETEGATR